MVGITGCFSAPNDGVAADTADYWYSDGMCGFGDLSLYDVGFGPRKLFNVDAVLCAESMGTGVPVADCDCCAVCRCGIFQLQKA